MYSIRMPVLREIIRQSRTSAEGGVAWAVFWGWGTSGNDQRKLAMKEWQTLAVDLIKRRLSKERTATSINLQVLHMS